MYFSSYELSRTACVEILDESEDYVKIVAQTNAGKQIDRQVNRQIDREMDMQINRQTFKLTHRQIDRHSNRQTEKHLNRQTESKKARRTDMEKDFKQNNDQPNYRQDGLQINYDIDTKHF